MHRTRLNTKNGSYWKIEMKEQKTALWSWSGKYPEVLDSREIGGHVQHLLKRAVYQGDEGTHWFCSCREFEEALNSQQAGSLSNIANQKPLECVHTRKI